MTRSEQDLLQIEDLSFGIAYWGEDWKNSISQHEMPNCIVFPGEGGMNTPLGIRRDGTFHPSVFGKFDFSETVQKISDFEQNIRYELKSAEGIPAAMLVLKSSLLTEPDYEKNPAFFNNRKVLPELKRQFSGETKDDNILRIPLKYGELTIKGKFGCRVLKNGRGIEFRLCFVPFSGLIKYAVLNLNFKYEPYQTCMVDLRSGVNMAFADEIEGDRKGGWTDQGANNDLRSLPVGQKEFAGIPFHIIDPKQNSGKSSLALRGEKRPYFLPSAKFSVPNYRGRYLYILNALGWEPKSGTPCGKVRVIYQDGTMQEHLLFAGKDTGNFWTPYNQENRVVAWKGRNKSAPIGLYATALPLDSQKKVVELEFLSQDQVWMIVAASITDRKIKKEAKVILRAGKDWLPLSGNTSIEKGSVADLSFLTDAPAGKYGFLKVVEDHFEFEKHPGVPVRFWGTNFCFSAVYADKEKTIRVLDDLVRMGYNSVRLHHFDQILTHDENKRGTFDPEKWDLLDFFVAEAKRRGIYITLDLFTARHEAAQTKHGDLSGREYKTLCYFDPGVRRSFLEFSQTLFNHVNPYTKCAWKDDPAIILLNLINEGTLTRTTNNMSPRVKKVVDDAYADYLTKKGIPIQPRSEKHWQKFLADTGKEFFADMKAKLGLKIPVSDQNFVIPAADTRNSFDYVDAHLYWAHPSFIGKKPWAPPFFTTTQSAISAWGGTISTIMPRRILGKPMTITEWNYCYPNPTYFEGPFLVAAYSAMQDFSGLWQFAYSHSDSFYYKERPLGAFDHSNNPVLSYALRMGALLFLRGDVKPASVTLAFSPKAAEQGASKLSLLTRVGLCYDPIRNVNAEIVERGEKMKTSALRIPAGKEQEICQKLIDGGILSKYSSLFDNGSVRSVTGELLLDCIQNTFCVITPKTEALLLPALKHAEGKILRVRNQDTFAAFALSSTDNVSLEKSKRLLLLHLTDNKTENVVFRDSSMSILENSGGGKQLIRRNRAELSLCLNGNYKVFACSTSGKRLFEIPAKREGGAFSFKLDNASDFGCVILYELVKE